MLKTVLLLPVLFDNRKVQRTDLFEIEIFCNSCHLFTVSVDQFNASLLNKSIYLFQKWWLNPSAEMFTSFIFHIYYFWFLWWMHKTNPKYVDFILEFTTAFNGKQRKIKWLSEHCDLVQIENNRLMNVLTLPDTQAPMTWLSLSWLLVYSDSLLSILSIWV